MQLARGDIGSALMTLEAADKPFEIRSIVWELLENSLLYGECNNRTIGTNRLIFSLGLHQPDSVLHELLSSPRACPDIVRECLAPYAIFYEFKKLQGGEMLSEAASLLSSLIQFAYLPGRFVGLLIGEWLPLLDNQNSVSLKVEDVVGTLNVLYKWQNDHERFAKGIDMLNMQLQIVRDGYIFDKDDWKVRYKDDIAKPEDVIQIFRTASARKISRAFLEESV